MLIYGVSCTPSGTEKISNNQPWCVNSYKININEQETTVKDWERFQINNLKLLIYGVTCTPSGTEKT